MTKADARAVAEIHSEALAGDFLPRLGQSFLTTLYECMIGAKVGFGIVYEKDNRIAGVAVSTENTRLFLKSLFLKRFWTLMPKMTWSLLRHPSLIKHSLETLLYGRQEEKDANPEAELLVMLVHKSYRRQGIGIKILRAMNKEFLQRGVKSYKVNTYADNKASNYFYSTHGFKYHTSFLMYKRKWNAYKCELTNSDTISCRSMNKTE